MKSLPGILRTGPAARNRFRHPGAPAKGPRPNPSSAPGISQRRWQQPGAVSAALLSLPLTPAGSSPEISRASETLRGGMCALAWVTSPDTVTPSMPWLQTAPQHVSLPAAPQPCAGPGWEGTQMHPRTAMHGAEPPAEHRCVLSPFTHTLGNHQVLQQLLFPTRLPGRWWNGCKDAARLRWHLRRAVSVVPTARIPQPEEEEGEKKRRRGRRVFAHLIPGDVKQRWTLCWSLGVATSGGPRDATVPRVVAPRSDGIHTCSRTQPPPTPGQ